MLFSLKTIMFYSYAIAEDVIKETISNRKKPRKDIFIHDILREANETFEVPTSFTKVLNRMLKDELAKLWHLRNEVLPKILTSKMEKLGNNGEVPSNPPKSSVPDEVPKLPVPFENPKLPIPAKDPKLPLSVDNPKFPVPAEDPILPVPIDSPKSPVPDESPKLPRMPCVQSNDDKMNSCVDHVQKSMHIEQIPADALQVIPFLVQVCIAIVLLKFRYIKTK